MKILPATDIINGALVRLTRGDYNAVKVYDADPVSTARSFAAKGAKYIHVVDLDGAKDPEKSNFKVISDIISAAPLKAEVGGGIRSMERIGRYLEAGAWRVIIGTAALTDPAFLDEALRVYGPERICVGVDAKGGFAATDGWTKTSTLDSFSFCRALRERGIVNIVYTDISRDGMLSGTNMEAYEKLVQIDGLRTVASGGICSISEIEALEKLGTDGAIIGKAMYEGLIDLAQAVSAAGEQC
ncbi:MAG TPA: 1-(5-phosphoribosyl)-5-[(5-phosphoribosylamino)methylideneamino]imidazole-4-carboxamide isomerase [Bacillota bacterium]|nr:1-(5-phosphoribosyl)-5-[(5-phosphoribosylamino)methylideneamino]imidazole-4-carboxamide isomerase [Bacillota bacterium]